MTIGQGIGLGALQGLTEFLPVSSSGHLVLARELLGVREPAVEFVVLAHAGSLLAILAFFWRDIVSLLTTRRRLLSACTTKITPSTRRPMICASLAASTGGLSTST